MTTSTDLGNSKQSLSKIPIVKPDLPSLDDIADAFREILSTGQVANFGRFVSQFEQEAQAYLQCQVVTVSSGTLGLLLTLQALGLEPGQKVILPSFTFVATAQAVVYAGGVPVLAEVGNDLTLSPADLEMLLNHHKDVSIVMPVHTYGLPCQVDAIQAVVDEASHRISRPIAVLYDAAHAFGATHDGRRVGGFGNAEVFSLSATKALVSIEGGMISSRNAGLIDRLRKMRNYGIEKDYEAHWPGLNGKMSELHAVIGLYNLRRLDAMLVERERKANYLLDRVQSRTSFVTLPLPEGATHTFKDITVLVPEALACQRGKVADILREHGVEVRTYFYPPVHEHRFFQPFVDRKLPHTESLARRVLTLPFFTTIAKNEIDRVVDTLVYAEESMK
jgi:dTDP-4-amino-4,6-dideoxygalactose transaminase